MTNRLNARQEAFAREYALHGNGAAAYRASYNPEAKPIKASELGRRLLRHFGVRARVEGLRGTPLPFYGWSSTGVPVPQSTAGLPALRDLAAAAFSETLPATVRLEAARSLRRVLPAVERELEAALEPTTADDGAPPVAGAKAE